MLALLALLTLQSAADEALRGTAGGAAVVDIASGNVAAAAGSAVQREASPGSAIKPFIAEIVLSSVRTPPPLRCSRKLRISGRSFDCVHPVLATGLDIPSAIAYSCNSAFASLALAIPPGQLTARLREYGFRVRDPANEDERRLLGLGEGIRISPLGLARAYARLARKHHPAILEGMRGAVEFGSAQLAAVPGLDVAGKTGTGIDSWFAGWAPAAAPAHSIAVMTAGGRGGGTAAPLAARILAALAPRRAPAALYEVKVQIFRDKRIITLDLEDYVDGVLGGEAAGLSPEAMKAIAVAARTYAVANRGRHKAEGFDFCESTHCQDFRGAGRSARTRAAVDATAGELLWYAGSPARVYYTGDCGGTTEAAGEVWSGERAPYLRQQPDPACVRRGTARWRYDLEAREFAITRRSASGRALQVRIDGRTMNFEEFSRATRFAVRSPMFGISRSGSRFVLDGRGAGHGIGLCQSGAEARASSGESYQRILDFYYPGTRTGITAQGLTWKLFHAGKLEVWAVEEPRTLLDPATRALRQAESAIGSGSAGVLRLRLYPSVAAFRDATGEPGWVAASTLDGVIRLQPAGDLALRGALGPTLLHEFLHVLVSQRIRAPVPRWFEEGLVCYLAEPEKPPVNAPLIESHIARPPDAASMRTAYEAARSRVKQLAVTHGRASVLAWLERGIPEAMARSTMVQAPTTAR